VVLCDDERRAQLGRRRLLIQSTCDGIRPGEVVHLAMPPGGEPRAVERGVVAGPHGRDASAVEPERERALLQPRGEVRSDAFHQTGWYPPRSPPRPARGPARARGLTPSSFHRGLTR